MWELQDWFELTGNLIVICAKLGIPSVVTLYDQSIACSRIHPIRPDSTFRSEREPLCGSCVDRDLWQTNEEVARAGNGCSVFAVHALASRAVYYLLSTHENNPGDLIACAPESSI